MLCRDPVSRPPPRGRPQQTAGDPGHHGNRHTVPKPLVARCVGRWLPMREWHGCPAVRKTLQPLALDMHQEAGIRSILRPRKGPRRLVDQLAWTKMLSA